MGSTGSIGTQALDVIALHEDKYNIVALSAHKNTELFFEQVRRFKPKYAALTGYDSFDIPTDLNFCEFIFGVDALETIAKANEVEYIIISVVGMVGLKSVLTSLKNGKRVLLANKEALVAGGKLVIDTAKNAAFLAKNNPNFVENASYFDGVDFPSPLSRLLPIDSEHSAIFQCMCGNSSNRINKIFLTCSGGPFRNWDKTNIDNATPKDALKHPKWNMGAKITIDSASLFNKALEVIEAKWLFNVNESDIDVLIHPQSIVHSMVGFDDGGIIAQLGEPSMKLPILYSLSYPERLNCGVNFPKLSNLEFYEPDTNKFESLKIVRECLKKDDASCLIMNAANEVAVDAFLKEKIKFGSITNAVKQVLNEIEPLPVNSLDEIIYADNLARQKTVNYINKLKGEN